MSRYTYGAAITAARTRSRVADMEARLREAAEDRRTYHARIREDAERIRSLDERLKRASRDLEAARAEVEQLKEDLGAARAEAALADIDRPRFTPAQMRRRPGNPLGEARLLAATAEAARWRMTKETP